MNTQTNMNTNTLRSRYVAVTEHGDVKLADAHNGKFKRFKKIFTQNHFSLQEEKAMRRQL